MFDKILEAEYKQALRSWWFEFSIIAMLGVIALAFAGWTIFRA